MSFVFFLLLFDVSGCSLFLVGLLTFVRLSTQNRIN
jgi:hypothetical protein